VAFEHMRPADPLPSLPHTRIERWRLSPGADRVAAPRWPTSGGGTEAGGSTRERAFRRRHASARATARQRPRAHPWLWLLRASHCGVDTKLPCSGSFDHELSEAAT
jgi:hypothetical protein